MQQAVFYPYLKESARIKKLNSFCWIIELYSNENTAISPIDAFLLSLCTGQYDTETISYLFANTLHVNTEAVTGLVQKTFDKYKKCLSFLEQPAECAERYNSADFLYDPTAAKGIRPRCETPVEMHLSLTHRCNFKCIYCFNAAGNTHENELSTKEWIDVIRQGKEFGVIRCTLTGGEPMMHPGFFQILEEVLKYDMLPTICTNGSFIDSETVGRLKSLKVPLVQISLDAATSETCDRLTAKKGSFEQITSAINMLVCAGIPVYVKAVLTPLNVKEAGGLVDLCAQLGVAQLTLDRYDVSSCGRGGTELIISKKDEEFVKEAVYARAEKYKEKLAVNVVSYPRKWHGEDDIIPCGAFRRSFIVLPSGDISACEKLVDVPHMSAGNVRRNSISEIWNSHRILDIIEPQKSELDEACKECEFIEKCGTGCYAIKHFLNKNPYGVDPRCFCSCSENNPYENL